MHNGKKFITDMQQIRPTATSTKQRLFDLMDLAARNNDIRTFRSLVQRFNRYNAINAMSKHL